MLSQRVGAVAVAGLIAACGEKGEPENITPPSQILRGLTVSPAMVRMLPGDTITLHVEPIPGLSTQRARWSVSNGELGVVDASNGLFRAKAAGSLMVVARLISDTSVVGAAVVHIDSLQTPAAGRPTSIAPSQISLHPGDSVQFAATVEQNDSVRWSVADTAMGEIDPSRGLFRAKAIGNTTVIAQRMTNTTRRDTAFVHVVPRS
jgi:hypothetical protein